MIKEKLKTGVPGLDEMLDGGLIPGRVYVVSGASGTGKTTLAMQFLLEGVRSGERVMYVALDEPPNEVRDNMALYGWDIGRVLVFDATPDILTYDKTPVRDVSTERKVQYFSEIPREIRKTSEKSPLDMTISTIEEILKLELKARKYTRIVIDSLTSLRYFYIRTVEENAALMSFLRVLADLGVTSLVTVHLPEAAKADVEAHMARGEIRLHKWFDGRGLVRGLTVEKYRGSAHDQRLRPIKIGKDGITVKKGLPERERLGRKAEKLAEDALMGAPEEAPKDLSGQEPAPAPHNSPDASASQPGEKTGDQAEVERR